MVGPKKAKILAKMNTLQGTHCILWIHTLHIQWMTVLQTFDKVLINKVFQKLSLIKNVFNKKCADKSLFSIKLDDSWHRKFTLKVRFCQQIDW